jgi:hypothetical protein
MSKTADPGGDIPIDVRKRQWISADAAFLARVPQKSIYNWMARGILDIGWKDPLTGRLYFSIADLIVLSVVHDLCVRPGVDFGPSKARPIADFVLKTALESVDRERNRDGFRPNAHVLVTWSEAGEMLIVAADIKDPARFYPPQPTAEYQPLRRAMIVIPATALFFDVFLRTQHVAERNCKAEAPWHV